MDGGVGGSPWLHKRGFGSAEAREGACPGAGARLCERRESLTPRGILPRFVALEFPVTAGGFGLGLEREGVGNRSVPDKEVSQKALPTGQERGTSHR